MPSNSQSSEPIFSNRNCPRFRTTRCMFGLLTSHRARQLAVTPIQRRGLFTLSKVLLSLELDGKSPQTFKAGHAFAEKPNEIHNFKNASATEPAKALGFQYARKGQALQVNAP